MLFEAEAASFLRDGMLRPEAYHLVAHKFVQGHSSLTPQTIKLCLELARQLAHFTDFVGPKVVSNPDLLVDLVDVYSEARYYLGNLMTAHSRFFLSVGGYA